jgi:hypothetical protein
MKYVVCMGIDDYSVTVVPVQTDDEALRILRAALRHDLSEPDNRDAPYVEIGGRMLSFDEALVALDSVTDVEAIWDFARKVEWNWFAEWQLVNDTSVDEMVEFLSNLDE